MIASIRSRAGSFFHCNSNANATPTIAVAMVAMVAILNDSQSGSQVTGSLRDTNDEDGAEVTARLDVQRAAVGLDRELAEVESEAAVGAGGRAPGLDLEVAAEDRIALGGGDRRAVVADGDLEAVAVAHGAHRDPAAARRIARRV